MMKKWIKNIGIFTTLVLMLIGNSYVLNAKSIEQDDVNISISIETQHDEIDITGTISNQSDTQITNAKLELTIPDKWDLKEGNLIIEDIELDAHSSYQTKLTLENTDKLSEIVEENIIENKDDTNKEESNPQKDDDTKTEDSLTNKETKKEPTTSDKQTNTTVENTPIDESNTEVESTSKNQTSTPQEMVPTADHTHLGLWIGLFIGSALGMILLWKYRKLAKIFLCLALYIGLLPHDVFAAESEHVISLEEQITIEGTTYRVSMKFQYTAKEDSEAVAELSDDIAALYGIDASIKDYDQDGLTNIFEIDVLGTHPAKKDSDENGILDSDEDLDQDGYSNIQEIEIGTDPTNKDSDKDGLNDFDEIETYLSNPLNPDSDEDNLSDSDEILLGLNPLKAKSDDQHLDSERLITQSLQEENIEDGLRINNIILPSLTLTTTGNINKRIFMDVYDVYAFGDSRSLIGKPIEIKGDQLGEGTLTFTSQQILTEYIICQYKDEQTLYLNTSYDYETNSLSTSIKEAGIYFVLDAATLLNELSGNTFIKEPIATQSIATINDNAMAQADIAFVLDTTYSMEENINHVKNNIVTFTKALNAQNVSIGLSLVDYQDLKADGIDSTKVHQNQNTTWIYDLNTYQTMITNLSLGGGGDVPECAVDALETTRQLSYRPSATKWLVLVTDATYKVDNRFGIDSLAEEVELLKQSGIKCIVVSSKDTKEQYRPLYEQTGGTWIDIYDDFQLTLKQLAKEIADDIYQEGHWIYLEGPIPIPVCLEAEPKAGSTTDTDKDGIYDIHELGDVVEMSASDLQQLITQAGIVLPEGVDYTNIKMYQYKSNPVEKDTDFDGREDGIDPKPKDNNFKATMHYSSDDTPKTCQIEFTMDYRQLIDGNPNVYSKDLSNLSVLYSSDIYDGLYIEFTDGLTGGSDNPTIFASMLGLNDVQNYHINGSDYGVDIDDQTQFLVGHRKVTYQGSESEVIIVSVRGTNGTNAEWSSNFDVGADTSDYYNAVEASHPHWKNKSHHKGFDVASNRVYDKLKAYINQYVDTSLPVKILINGHSRGAAIANILAKDLVDDTSYQVNAYTFACPNTTTATNTANYPMIFNVINTDDMIPYMPLTQWGFNRYGINKSISVAQYYEDSIGEYDEGTFEWLCGYDYNDDSLTQNTLSKIVKIANTREDFYRYTDEEVTKVWEDDLGHITYNGAVEEYNQLTTDLTNEKLLRFCSLSIQSGFLHHVEIHYCPAYLMQTLANMVTSVGPLLGRDVAGRFADAKTAFVASSGKVVIGGMTHPHMQPTYYLIVRNNFNSLP